MKSIKLESKKRELFGRKVKRLRKEGLIPANIFGKKIKSQAISVDSKEFEDVFKQAGETQIIDLSGKPVLVSNVSYDPVTDNFLHVDFRQVDLTEKITASVPIVSENESPAERQGLGTVVVQIDEVEVEALPTELPENITIDLSILEEVDQAIYAKDLKVPGKTKVMEDPESIIAKVEPPQKEEEPEPVVPAEGEEAVEGEAVEGESEETQDDKEAVSDKKEGGGEVKEEKKETPQTS